MKNKMTRRTFGKLSLVGVSMVTWFGKMVFASGKDLPLITPSHPQYKAMGYVEKSPKGKCKDCAQWGKGPSQQPGSCPFFTNPDVKVPETAYCNMFAKK